jgi:hypothetical protein
MGIDRFWERQWHGGEENNARYTEKYVQVLRDQIAELKELLKIVEWNNGELGDCFFCEGTEPRGHEKSCRLDKELNKQVG